MRFTLTPDNEPHPNNNGGSVIGPDICDHGVPLLYTDFVERSEEVRQDHVISDNC